MLFARRKPQNQKTNLIKSSSRYIHDFSNIAFFTMLLLLASMTGLFTESREKMTLPTITSNKLRNVLIRQESLISRKVVTRRLTKSTNHMGKYRQSTYQSSSKHTNQSHYSKPDCCYKILRRCLSIFTCLTNSLRSILPEGSGEKCQDRHSRASVSTTFSNILFRMAKLTGYK